MTPDLPTRVREAFYATYGTCSEDHNATDAALAAVIAVVQEDRTREIVEWLREDDLPVEVGRDLSGVKVHGQSARVRAASIIEAKFGGTTHD